MEQSVIGLVILIVACVSLLGGVAWILLSKKDGDWPKWSTKKGVFGDNEALLCVENEDSFLDFSAEKMALAANCVAEAWKELGYENLLKVEKTLQKTGMIITTVDTFPKLSGASAARVAAVQIWMKTKLLEKRFPVIVVHEAVIDKLDTLNRSMSKIGEPAIHEMCHAASEVGFGDTSYSHTDPRVWEATGRAASLQAVAKRIWSETVL